MRPISFPYKVYAGCWCPIVRVGLKGPAGWIQAEAYVDSGATVSIFSLNEAAGLGLNYRKGKKTPITVGDGDLIPVYIHRLWLQIGTVRFLVHVGFSSRLGVGFNLLGRQDVFTHFDITFSDSRHTILFKSLA